jgi:hypothetical protein
MNPFFCLRPDYGCLPGCNVANVQHGAGITIRAIALSAKGDPLDAIAERDHFRDVTKMV